MISTTLRDKLYDLLVIKDKKELKIEFFKILNDNLKKTPEIKLPLQLFEKLFKFDFHREVKHPISSNIIIEFKENGLRISKIRNKYQVRIRKN